MRFAAAMFYWIAALAPSHASGFPTPALELVFAPFTLFLSSDSEDLSLSEKILRTRRGERRIARREDDVISTHTID